MSGGIPNRDPTEPVTFVIENCAGMEFSSIVYGLLPQRLTRKGSTLLIYSCRLDKLPDGEKFIKLSPRELYRQFCERRAAGKQGLL